MDASSCCSLLLSAAPSSCLTCIVVADTVSGITATHPVLIIIFTDTVVVCNIRLYVASNFLIGDLLWITNMLREIVLLFFSDYCQQEQSGNMLDCYYFLFNLHGASWCCILHGSTRNQTVRTHAAEDYFRLRELLHQYQTS